MNTNIKACLFDILQSITEIESYFSECQMSLEQFPADIKTKRAVERNLEIIGEAAYRIRKDDPAFKLEHFSKIIATRNRIIHGYDTVSDDLVWSILINHIPKLKDEISLLLK